MYNKYILFFSITTSLYHQHITAPKTGLFNFFATKEKEKPTEKIFNLPNDIPKSWLNEMLIKKEPSKMYTFDCNEKGLLCIAKSCCLKKIEKYKKKYNLMKE